MIIGIDVDGVLANLLTHCATISPALKHALETPEAHYYHDAFACLGDSEGELWKYIDENPGFVKDCPPFEGAVEFVAALRSLGTLIAVTSPASSPPTWGHEREHWLRDNLNFERGQIIQTPGKAYVDCDVLIEDNPKHLERWWQHRTKRLMRGPHRPLAARVDPAWLYMGVLFVDNRYRVPDQMQINYVACDSYMKIVNAVSIFKQTLE